MDYLGYIDWVEQHVEDDVTLARIRDQAAADAALSPEHKDDIEERVGMYLADLEREAGPMEVDGPDTEDDDVASTE